MRENFLLSFALVAMLFRVVLSFGIPIVKFIFVVCLILGAVREMATTNAPFLGEALLYIKSVHFDFPTGAYFSWIASSWLPLAVLLILLKVLNISSYMEGFRKSGQYATIFASTMLNYFNVGSETEQQILIKEKGIWKAIKQSWLEQYSEKILFGEVSDPLLYSKPKRDGNPVSFQDDLKSKKQD